MLVPNWRPLTCLVVYGVYMVNMVNMVIMVIMDIEKY